MKIADGIEMLELPIMVNGKESIACPVLIPDGDETLLVDTGYPGQLGQLREAMEAAGLPFEKICRILITHHDLDHIGCLAAIVRERNGKALVMAHPEEKPYIQGDEQPLKLVQMEARLDSLKEPMKSLYEGMKRGYALSTSKVDIPVSGGETIPWAGGIDVIYTPGHTIGHISLYLRKSGTLISGDTLFVENGRLVKAPAFANHDNNLAKDSLRKLTKYDIHHVLCYHGGYYGDNPNKYIAELSQE